MPVAVGQPSFVQNLEQYVEYVLVGLLDLVEQNDAVRFLPDSLAQLSTLVVSDISGRGADEPADGYFLHVFAHVQAYYRIRGVEQLLGQQFRKMCLADSRRTKEKERSDRSAGVSESGHVAGYGPDRKVNSLVLSDYPVHKSVSETADSGFARDPYPACGNACHRGYCG